MKVHTLKQVLRSIRWHGCVLHQRVQVECGEEMMEQFRALHAPKAEVDSHGRVRFTLWRLPYRTNVLQEPFDFAYPNSLTWHCARYEMVNITWWSWFGWPRGRYYAVERVWAS